MRRAARGLLVAAACLAAIAPGCSRKGAPAAPDAATPPPDAGASLAFTRDGAPLRSLTLAQMEAKVPAETLTLFDPYYQKPKRFRALPLRKVLELGFAGVSDLGKREYVFRASDGFTVPIRGELALEDGAYVAFADLDVPGWEPIGPQHVSPGPFYLVWSKPSQANEETYPRPWQLASIDMTPFEKAFPHTSPGDLPADAPAEIGYGLFRDRCIRCHAINREGGHVGPDLNVPQNITEYRPEAQIRAYIRDPLTFRYGNMPPHPDLSDADLDHLIAYLKAMKARKYDPGAR